MPLAEHQPRCKNGSSCTSAHQERPIGELSLLQEDGQANQAGQGQLINKG